MDFDGTITTKDTGVHLLDRLAPACWLDIEEQYKSGEIGSRECMVRQWALVPPDRARIEAVVREVPLDPAFDALVGYLREEGAEVSILSDGYGFRAEEVGAQAGLPVLTNRIDWERHEVVFPEVEPSCACSTCGTCKRAPIEEARRRGRVTVLVGDGTSDARAAEVADVVFAKDELARRCEERGITHNRFGDLSDVLRLLRAAS